jgi:hypothetical protein
MWGAEFGQEGAVVWAADVATGEVKEQHRIGAREVNGLFVDSRTDEVYITTTHGLRQPGLRLVSWSPQRPGKLAGHGFPPLSGQRFASCMLCTRTDRLWAGTHPGGHLASFDLVTRRWADHGAVLVGAEREQLGPTQQIWCYPHSVRGSGAETDVVVRTWTHERWLAFNVATEKLTVLDGEPPPALPPPPPPTTPRKTKRRAHSAISLPPDMQVTTWGPDYQYTVDGIERRVQYQPSVATDICGLSVGPGDGCLYGSTAISMRLFRVDTRTDALADLGRVGWGSGEIYQTISGPDGKVYFGSYGGGFFGSYDPARPWDPQPGPSSPGRVCH